MDKRLQGECGGDDAGRTMRVSVSGKIFLDRNEYQGVCGDVYIVSLRVERRQFRVCGFVPYASIQEAIDHGLDGRYGYPVSGDRVVMSERQNCVARRSNQPMMGFRSIADLGHTTN
jgi:hypothetical protein